MHVDESALLEGLEFELVCGVKWVVVNDAAAERAGFGKAFLGLAACGEAVGVRCSAAAVAGA